MKRKILLLFFSLIVLTGCHNGETNSKSTNSETSLSPSAQVSDEQLILNTTEQPNSTTQVDAPMDISSTYTTAVSNEEQNNSSSVKTRYEQQAITIQETTSAVSEDIDPTPNTEQTFINESEAEQLAPMTSPDDDSGVVVFPIMPIE